MQIAMDANCRNTTGLQHQKKMIKMVLRQHSKTSCRENFCEFIVHITLFIKAWNFL